MPRTCRRWIFSLAAIAVGGSAQAFLTKKPKSHTWDSVISHVLKNGVDRPIKSPTSRSLGFDADETPAKAMRVPSKSSGDGKEHAILIVYSNNEKGEPQARDIVIGATRVTTILDKQHVEGLRVRLDPTGEKIISALRSKGVIGEVLQTIEDPTSRQLRKDVDAEKKYFLSLGSLSQLE